ncbi:hypothetical protein STENM327S_01526 [Streptomyces tendae]
MTPPPLLPPPLLPPFPPLPPTVVRVICVPAGSSTSLLAGGFCPMTTALPSLGPLTWMLVKPACCRVCWAWERAYRA